METLEIEFVDVGENYLVAKMPVSSKVHQPDGVLHGGATVSANHVRSISEGEVYARATIIHKGRTTQLWDIRITDKEGNLISICKLTTIALPRA